VRKSGVVSIVGDYIGYANHFPIGAVMEKYAILHSDTDKKQITMKIRESILLLINFK
jgi:hypothetical protein